MNFNADLARITGLTFTRKVPSDGSSIHVKELALVKVTAKVFAHEQWAMRGEYEFIKKNHGQIKSVDIDTSDRGYLDILIDSVAFTAFPKSAKVSVKKEDGVSVFVFNFVFEKPVNEQEDTLILNLINLKEPNEQGKMVPKLSEMSTNNSVR